MFIRVHSWLTRLLQMRVKVSAFGQEQFASWREREHDGLVLAVALACWWVTVKCR